MSESTITYGWVYSLKETNYIKITVAVDIPFKRKFLNFILWDDSLLKHGNERIGVDETVEVTYYYDGPYPKLRSISPAIIAGCSNCGCTYEQGDAQRMDCPRMCEGDTDTIRVEQDVILLAKTVKPFKYGDGCCLKFINSKQENFNCVIFANHPFFEKVCKFDIMKSYKLVGWMRADDCFRNVSVVDL